MTDYNLIVQTVIEKVLDNLAPDELRELRTIIAFNKDIDPRTLPYWDKIASLYMEEFDPPIMHESTKDLFPLAVLTYVANNPPQQKE